MHTDIKTFEDACKVRGIDPNNLPDFSMIPEQHRQALTDHYKLVIIAEALNEGWKPDWNNDDEYKYYPWFDMENGFVFLVSDFSDPTSCVGSRLCYRSREIAEYAGKQFEGLYKSYFQLSQ